MNWIIIIGFLLSGTWSIAQEKEINVFVVVSEDCPICIYMTDRLRVVEKTFRGKANFHLVFPVSRSNHKTVALFKQSYRLQAYKLILDHEQQWSRRMGASVTPELIITSGTEKILYRGRINDAYYAPGRRKKRHASNEMERNIHSALAGEPIPKPWPSAIGCYVTYSK